MSQHIAENGIGICLISEPRHITDSQLWFASNNRKAAIHWRPEYLKQVCTLLGRGENFVAVKCNDINFISCYISPNIEHDEYLEALDEMGESVQQIGRGLIVGGDFNGKSTQWGSLHTNRRGELIEEWAAELDLRLANIGDTPTCVRPQGTSIVDLTWITADLIEDIANWRVETEIENLSDHRYIAFEIGKEPLQQYRCKQDRKWNFAKLDVEMLQTSLNWACSVNISEEEATNTEGWQKWTERVMREACNASAPRCKQTQPRKRVYWWNEHIAQLRTECHKKRRVWTRSKKWNQPEETAKREREYKTARSTLRREINKAKSAAWQELVQLVDSDPWGLSYKIVLGKLRRATPGLTEMLEERTLNDLLNKLFPMGQTHDPKEEWRDFEWNEEEDHIRFRETKESIKDCGGSSVAPGLDGVKSIVWKNIPDLMVSKMTQCYNMCLSEGKFPKEWKKARLVLIPKAQTSESQIPKARPICLLNEVGKIFERVLVNRLTNFMNNEESAQLSPVQYGFREKRSTCDALMRIKEIIEETTTSGRVAVAVAIDIENAFNSLPWPAIRNAMRRKGFPDYLCRIVDDYLDDRYIEYKVREGDKKSRSVTAGVPQGSVLGPILWNIGYDSVLDVNLEPGCHLSCYADDTLIVATADDIETAITKANIQVARVVERIKGLGLVVAANKTEAAVFYNGKKNKPNKICDLIIEKEAIKIGESLKYLGVILDSCLNFKEHFLYMENKAIKVLRALSRLMPNLRGPSEAKRRLFTNVIMSILTYGAPVWSDALMATKKI